MEAKHLLIYIIYIKLDNWTIKEGIKIFDLEQIIYI